MITGKLYKGNVSAYEDEIYIGETEPEDLDVKIWIDPNETGIDLLTLDELNNYTSTNLIKRYNIVEDLKNDAELKVGDVVQTLGYYEIGDGGSAYYQIVNTKNISKKDIEYIEISGSLFAEFIFNDSVNVNQFGCKGDGIKDNTTILSQVLNTFKKINFYNGEYIFQELTINNNDLIINGNLATIKGVQINFQGDNNKIYNLKYDGNLSSKGFFVTGDNFNIFNSELFNIKNTFSGPGYAINLTTSNYSEIKNCKFYNLISGNESAPEGEEEGSIRAIIIYGSDNVIVDGNKFDGLDGKKDGDYIHVQFGEDSYVDNEFPYNGVKRGDVNNISIINNTFFQKECKSCVKVQCSNTKIKNNNFIVKNNTSSQYATIRVQSGDFNDVIGNKFNIINNGITINKGIFYETTANGNILDNTITVEKMTVDSSSSQNIINLKEVSNINIKNNIINNGDIRYVFYLDSIDNCDISNNTIESKYEVYNGIIFRFLTTTIFKNTNNYIKNNKILTKNSGQIFELKDCVNNSILSNEIYFDRSGTINIFTNIDNLKFNYNNFVNNYDGSSTVYPVVFGDGCLNLEFINNFCNECNAFFRMNAEINNFVFTANGNFNDKSCTYNFSGQDMTQYKYLKSNYVSQNYDFGFNDPQHLTLNSGTYYNKTTKKLMIYVDSWINIPTELS